MSEELGLSIRTHITRGMYTTPSSHAALGHITREIALLGGAEHFEPRRKHGVTVFPWAYFASLNPDVNIDTPDVIKAVRATLPPRARNHIRARIGKAQVYDAPRRSHIAYPISSPRLDEEYTAVRDALADLKLEVPDPSRDFHLSVGSFDTVSLRAYQKEDADDPGPLELAVNVANMHRDRLPRALRLGALSINQYWTS